MNEPGPGFSRAPVDRVTGRLRLPFRILGGKRKYRFGSNQFRWEGLPMARESRRIVTGHDAEGKSVIVIDGPPTPFGAYWLTDATPVDNTSPGDAGQQVRTLEPPPGGSIFRLAAIPPEDPNVSPEERGRHPGMHKTRTVDYVVLLSGEVTLLLDKGEVDLKPFDVVVQRGTSHAWVNKSKEPAVLAAVLIDAKEV